MTRMITMCVLACSLATGCARDDGYNSGRDRSGSMGSLEVGDTSGERTLSIMHAINDHEIEMAEMAGQRASSQAVRTYASMIVRDHQALDRDVESRASEFGVKLVSPDNVRTRLHKEGSMESPERTIEHMRDLGQKTGDSFDRAFLDSMRKGHADAIKILESERVNAEPRVQAVIDRALPVVRAHLRESERLLQTR